MSSVDRPRVFSRSFSLCRLPPGASLLVPISSWPPFCQRFLHQLAQKSIWIMAFASTLWIMQTSVHIFVLQACSGNNSIFPQTIIALLPQVTVNAQTLPALVRPTKGKSPVILTQGLPISRIMSWKKCTSRSVTHEVLFPQYEPKGNCPVTLSLTLQVRCVTSFRSGSTMKNTYMNEFIFRLGVHCKLREMCSFSTYWPADSASSNKTPPH
jgi:hypothetical protein